MVKGRLPKLLVFPPPLELLGSHTVLPVSAVDLVLSRFCVYVRDSASVIQSVIWHHILVLEEKIV